jgi:hypothetical protein
VPAWGNFAQFLDFYSEMFPKEQYQERAVMSDQSRRAVESTISVITPRARNN